MASHLPGQIDIAVGGANDVNGEYYDAEGEYYSDSADEWDAPPAALDDNERRSNGNTPEDARRAPVPAHLEGIERELAGEKVQVTFHFPSGETTNQVFYMGQTVEYLKSYLEDQHNLSYASTTLYLGDRLLLDPLSLNDLPFRGGGEDNHVRVAVQ